MKEPVKAEYLVSGLMELDDEIFIMVLDDCCIGLTPPR